jgi:hypothetical protein
MIRFIFPKENFNAAYFQNIRNWYHPIVGIAINYLLSILFFCNRVEFPLLPEYWWNYLYPIICSVPAFIAAFFGEKKQDDDTGTSVSDMRDVYFTGFPSLIGGYLSMYFVSWYLALSLIIISLLLIVFKHKK